jgi:hypothetical protein
VKSGSGTDLGEAEAKRIVDLYRQTYTGVTAFWKTCSKAIKAIADDDEFTFGREGLYVVDGKRGVKLPSGLYMQYPQLENVKDIESGEEGYKYKLRNGYECVFKNSLEQAVLEGDASVCPQLMERPPTIADMTLWGDYIYLDTEERRRFVSSKHEYLIEQTQQQKRFSIPANARTATVPLTFNHPMKEMIWVVNQDRMLDAHEFFNYGSRMLLESGIPNLDLITSAVIQFDGYDRFEEQSAEYFRLVQPWQRHTAIPNDFIYVYSFSLAPEAAQPQGSCNASRLDSIVLQAKMNPGVVSRPCGITVYATNYNVLRIVAGLGGVLFTV